MYGRRGGSRPRVQESGPGTPASRQGPIRLPREERTPASSHRIFSGGPESPPPLSSSPRLALDVLPRSISFRPSVSAPPLSRTPRPQILQKTSAPAPTHLPLHSPPFRSPRRSVIR